MLLTVVVNDMQAASLASPGVCGADHGAIVTERFS
jgi:hypothetical protein